MVGDWHSGKERAMHTARRPTITELNDEFRTNPMRYGRVMLTAGVNAIGADFVMRAMRLIANYGSFPHGDDPYREHDFGAFVLDGQRLFWKIDYYDPTMEAGSEDPADRSKTVRVMTVMLASEY